MFRKDNFINKVLTGFSNYLVPRGNSENFKIQRGQYLTLVLPLTFFVEKFFSVILPLAELWV